MSTLITLTRHVNHEKMLIRRFLTAESRFEKEKKTTAELLKLFRPECILFFC